MTILRETTEVLLINMEHLNKDNLSKQVLELKEKIAFVPSNKNITELNKHYSASLLHSQSKKASQLSRSSCFIYGAFSSSGGGLPSLIPF